MVVEAGSVIKRTVYFTPKTLLFFDMAKEMGYEGDLSAFMNECVANYHAQKGITLGYIMQSAV